MHIAIYCNVYCITPRGYCYNVGMDIVPTPIDIAIMFMDIVLTYGYRYNAVMDIVPIYAHRYIL